MACGSIGIYRSKAASEILNVARNTAVNLFPSVDTEQSAVEETADGIAPTDSGTLFLGDEGR